MALYRSPLLIPAASFIRGRLAINGEFVRVGVELYKRVDCPGRERIENWLLSIYLITTKEIGVHMAALIRRTRFILRSFQVHED